MNHLLTLHTAVDCSFVLFHCVSPSRHIRVVCRVCGVCRVCRVCCVPCNFVEVPSPNDCWVAFSVANRLTSVTVTVTLLTGNQMNAIVLLSVVITIAGGISVAAGAGTGAGACTTSGQVKWVYNTTATNVGDPSFGDGAVFLAADQTIYALEGETGVVRWKVVYPQDNRPREKMPGLSRHGGESGVVFVVISGGQFLALSQRTGKQVWSYQTDSQGWCANPQPDDENDLVFSYTPTTLYAVTTSTGKLKWSKPLNNSEFDTECTVTVHRDERERKSYVYVASNGAQNKFEAETGKLVWSFAMTGDRDAHGTASVAVCTDEHDESTPRYATFLVEGGYSNSLIALHPDTGKLAWNFTCEDSNSTNYDNIANHNPSALGAVFVKCIYSLFAVNCRTGQPEWSFLAPASDGGLSSPSVYTDRARDTHTLYVGSDTEDLLALNAVTGELLWTGHTHGDLWSDPIRVGEAVFVGSQDGGFYAFCA